MSTFGERLRQIRMDRDLSQQDLAEILGTSKQVISRYETNQRSPKVTVASAYAERLGVSLDFLMGIDANIETAPSNAELEGAIDQIFHWSEGRSATPEERESFKRHIAFILKGVKGEE